MSAGAAAGAEGLGPAALPHPLGVRGAGGRAQGGTGGVWGGCLLSLGPLTGVLLCILPYKAKTSRAPRHQTVLGGDSGEEEPWETLLRKMRRGEGQEDCEHLLGGGSWRRLGAEERLSMTRQPP